jgi:hypothetical protein
MIQRLNTLNKFEIKSIESKDFKKYGKILNNYDFKQLIDYLNEKTEIPSDGNLYIAHDKEMDRSVDLELISSNIYGGINIQVGYCNGRNSTLNGLEYHKGSEVNVFATDGVLLLGLTTNVDNNYFNVNDVEAFFIPKGSAVELYQTTMHFAPCKVDDDGFKVVVILPKGTNEALKSKPNIKEEEDKLLFMKNKWLIAHPERTPLIEKGAYGGIVGENLKVLY